MAVTILTGQGDIAIFLFISVQYLTFKGSNNISFQQRSLNTRFATRDEKYYPLVRGLGKKKDGDLLQINRSLKVFYVGVPVYQNPKWVCFQCFNLVFLL